MPLKKLTRGAFQQFKCTASDFHHPKGEQYTKSQIAAFGGFLNGNYAGGKKRYNNRFAHSVSRGGQQYIDVSDTLIEGFITQLKELQASKAAEGIVLDPEQLNLQEEYIDVNAAKAWIIEHLGIKKQDSITQYVSLGRVLHALAPKAFEGKSTLVAQRVIKASSDDVFDPSQGSPARQITMLFNETATKQVRVVLLEALATLAKPEAEVRTPITYGDTSFYINFDTHMLEVEGSNIPGEGQERKKAKQEFFVPNFSIKKATTLRDVIKRIKETDAGEGSIGFNTALTIVRAALKEVAMSEPMQDI